MQTLDVTDATFEQEVLKSDTLVLVDFWAGWCTPCKIVSPTIDEIAKENEGKVKVAKVDVDANPNSPGRYGVMSIPTVILFKNGEPQKSFIGVQPKENYQKAIEEIAN